MSHQYLEKLKLINNKFIKPEGPPESILTANHLMNYFLWTGLSKKGGVLNGLQILPTSGYGTELVSEPGLEFLLQTTKKPLKAKATVEYSRHFSYSLERRIKPLFWVIECRSICCSLTDIFA